MWLLLLNTYSVSSIGITHTKKLICNFKDKTKLISTIKNFINTTSPYEVYHNTYTSSTFSNKTLRFKNKTN